MSGRKHRRWIVAIAIVVGAMASLPGIAVAGDNAKALNKADPSNLVTPGKQLPNPAAWATAVASRNGIKLLGTYDDSGPNAWDPAAHPTAFFTSLGVGYGGFASTNTHPGVVIIDAETKKIVTYRTYDIGGVKTYFESHGLGVSPDGQWIYIPTGDSDKRAQGYGGRIIVVNARTLKIHQVIQTKSIPHHFKAFTRSDGRQLVMGEDFNWQAPAFGLRPGSGVYVLDPLHNNQVIADINADKVQGNPYLAFANPTGDSIWIGLPPGPISDPDIHGQLDGSWAVVSTKTWQPVKYFKGGEDPIWTAFTPDGKYAYLCDGGSNHIWKIDAVALKVAGQSNASVNGGYGCHLGWVPNQLWVIEKGEASHNRGKNIGLVDSGLMVPLDEYNTGWIRADHGTVNPLQQHNELWVTANSTFEVVVWNMGLKKVTARIPMPLGSSTHSGSFVTYNPDFTGAVTSDQNGLHGAALELQKKLWAQLSPKK